MAKPKKQTLRSLKAERKSLRLEVEALKAEIESLRSQLEHSDEDLRSRLAQSESMRRSLVLGRDQVVQSLHEVTMAKHVSDQRLNRLRTSLEETTNRARTHVAKARLKTLLREPPLTQFSPASSRSSAARAIPTA